MNFMMLWWNRFHNVHHVQWNRFIQLVCIKLEFLSNCENKICQWSWFPSIVKGHKWWYEFININQVHFFDAILIIRFTKCMTDKVSLSIWIWMIKWKKSSILFQFFFIQKHFSYKNKVLVAHINFSGYLKVDGVLRPLSSTFCDQQGP